MKQIDIIREFGNGTYLDCYDEIENSFKIGAFSEKIEVTLTKSTRLKRYFLKIILIAPFLTSLLKSKNNRISFSMLMGGGFELLLPHIFKYGNNFVYMYDAWPRFHDLIQRQAEVLNIKTFFFSSNQVAQLFAARNSNIKCYWIPEGIKVDDYHFLPYQEKTIDVLEFGRKFDLYHDKIKPSLEANGYSHIYEKKKEEVIFKTREDFLNGLASAKISICIPSDITHPERSEGISSMTLRYLQSMASKCLIVGVLPREMEILFDYCPIIEIDSENPEHQILEILNNYESYLPLIEKNYKNVCNEHTWVNRKQKMLSIITNE